VCDAKAANTNLPPDPGKAGKATVEGVDADMDGVRDDVQIAISERYPDDQVKQAALAQKTRALEEALAAGSSGDINAIIKASKSIIQAVKCLHQTMENPTAEIGFLEYTVVNTTERSDAYMNFNEGLNGQFFGTGSRENPCE
jgi:hypothetical protein